MGASIESLRRKLASSTQDYAYSVGVPGTPLMLRPPDAREERLPGMRRWASREAIERAFKGLEAGDDPQQMEDEAASAGVLSAPLFGALSGGALGMGAAKVLKAKSPLTHALVGALLGGVGGAAKHYQGRESTREDFREALHGARTEMAAHPRTALPSSRSDQSTATASTPLLLSTGPAN